MTVANSWETTCIADICESIVDCLNRTAPVVEGITPFKMIRTTNVRDGWLDLSSAKYVDEATYQKWTRRQVPRRGDIILTREAPLGEVGMLRTTDHVFLGQRLVSYRVDPTKADNRFLLYAFQTHELQSQIRALGAGATVEHMRVPDGKTLMVTLPPLPIQRRIASVLSAYDDLIENNTRRIAILEEMARRLYDEWFVQFRFPGHEEAEFVETEQGQVPATWPLKCLGEIVDFNPKTKVPKEGDKLFVPMQALSTNSMVISGLETKAGNSGAKFQNGDTLVARITPCLENGKTGYVDFLPTEQPTACGSTEYIVLRSKTLCPEMVYCIARSAHFRDIAIKSMSGASGRQRVQEASLHEILITQPDNGTLTSFRKLASPAFKQVSLLARKNINLRAQRDLLLPKLISGKINVSDLPVPGADEQIV